MFPSTEEIAELKVTSENAPAEYGQVGDLTFTTKGGTNQFHGSLFEYLQNDAVNAIPEFATSKPKTGRQHVWRIDRRAKSRYRRFTMEKIKRFFFYWESNRQRSQASIVNDVPTTQMRSGDLSGLCGTYNPVRHLHRP